MDNKDYLNLEEEQHYNQEDVNSDYIEEKKKKGHLNGDYLGIFIIMLLVFAGVFVSSLITYLLGSTLINLVTFFMYSDKIYNSIFDAIFKSILPTAGMCSLFVGAVLFVGKQMLDMLGTHEKLLQQTNNKKKTLRNQMITYFFTIICLFFLVVFLKYRYSIVHLEVPAITTFSQYLLGSVHSYFTAIVIATNLIIIPLFVMARKTIKSGDTIQKKFLGISYVLFGLMAVIVICLNRSSFGTYISEFVTSFDPKDLDVDALFNLIGSVLLLALYFAACVTFVFIPFIIYSLSKNNKE